ncbi:MAG: rRNA adenine N-6-methyltransferase family protein [Patescibacteria group bacterium]|jgi:16S rRNA (adenine1518-N6/adenine1519-N6)-dimethyltransferase
MNELKAKTQELLKKYRITPDPVHFGQHFLVEPGTIDVFVKTCSVTKESRVLEIGPGLGFITKGLLRKAESVTVFEVDMRFEKLLRDIQKEFKTLHFSISNILQNDDFNYDVVCGALSYSIFEPLLRKIFANEDFRYGVFIVSEKIEKDYEEHDSVLALLIEAFFEISFVKLLPKQFFYPVPRADGMLIALKRRNAVSARHLFLQQLFLQGDKKAKNALREGLINSSVNQAHVLTKKESRALLGELTNLRDSNESIFQCSKEFLKKIYDFFQSYGFDGATLP